MHCWWAALVIAGLRYGRRWGRSKLPICDWRLQIELESIGDWQLVVALGGRHFGFALALGGLTERAAFPPAQTAHSVGADLGEDGVDLLLLDPVLPLALLGLED